MVRGRRPPAVHPLDPRVTRLNTRPPSTKKFEGTHTTAAEPARVARDGGRTSPEKRRRLRNSVAMSNIKWTVKWRKEILWEKVGSSTNATRFALCEGSEVRILTRFVPGVQSDVNDGSFTLTLDFLTARASQEKRTIRPPGSRNLYGKRNVYRTENSTWKVSKSQLLAKHNVAAFIAVCAKNNKQFTARTIL